jgi:hypothetical protein
MMFTTMYYLPQVAVLRVLHQLSQVYSVMKIDSLAALIPFFSSSEVEQLLVDAVKHGYLQVCWPYHDLLQNCPLVHVHQHQLPQQEPLLCRTLEDGLETVELIRVRLRFKQL